MKFIKDNSLLLFLMLAVLITGGSLMGVSQHVYEKQKHVQSLDKEVLAKQWDIRALKAELAYLSRPDRLEQIASAMKQSDPVPKSQYPIAPVSYQILNDLPKAMSVLPPEKPAIAVNYKPKRAPRHSPAPAPIVHKKAAPTPALEATPQKTVEKDKSQGFASLIDNLGGNE